MSDIRKAIEMYGKSIAEEKLMQACRIAKDKVQNDFNNEVVEFVASYTGHPNLSQSVFLDVELDSIDLNVNKYTEEAFVAGLFKSNSSLHPGFGGWDTDEPSILSGMSRNEFWHLKKSGFNFGTHGGVSSGWLVDNFWAGIVVGTNGWPRGNAEFLAVYTSSEASGADAVKQYIARYKSSGRYPKYILEAIKQIT